MTFNWSGKRRWVALLLLIAGFVVMLTVPPVIPVIQLPGEVWPNGWMTNTLAASIIVWILLILLAFYTRGAMPKGSNEVPRGGFYNLFEMAFEGLYGFVRNITGERYLRYIFSFFMTIFLIVLLSNWIELIPGVDSVGFLHARAQSDPATGAVEVEEGFELNTVLPGVYALDPDCPWLSPEETAVMTVEARIAREQQNCATGTTRVIEGPEALVAGAEHELEPAADSESAEAGVEAAATEAAVAHEGAVTGDTEGAVEEGGRIDEAVEPDPEAAETGEPQEERLEAVHAPTGDPRVPWHIIPFLRAPSTDLNMTAALALIAVVMTQVLGFRALGIGYLTKFFNFRTLLTSPLGGIDVAVGLLELIGEFARILSFAFRLLGNIFAGSILLFVMSFLIPFLPWPFFILEFFVGIIQALVFALLTAIFMNLATASHHAEDEHGHAEEIPVEASAVGEMTPAHP